jgi:hypothetical protein
LILKNNEAATPAKLFNLICETLAEIDRTGRPWDGWRESLTEEQRRRIKHVEREIDRACLAGDHAGLVAAIETYRRLLFAKVGKIR